MLTKGREIKCIKNKVHTIHILNIRSIIMRYRISIATNISSALIISYFFFLDILNVKDILHFKINKDE